MIELFDSDKRDINRKSSKGNQLKWEKNGVWYKADYTGYEGLSEYVISHLLEKSSLKADEYVVYEQEEIRYGSVKYMGASSKNFLKAGEQLITLERLFLNIYGVGLNKMIYSTNDHTERLKLIVSKVQDITGLSGFGIYMSKLMTIDAFFLNEDRHTHNIAVILRNDGKYDFCPIFDQGAGLLSDITMDYPLSGDVFDLMLKVKPKTFCQDFDEQLDIAEKLYGKELQFGFTKKDVDDILDSSIGYETAVVERVREIIYQQMHKYSYLFR